MTAVVFCPIARGPCQSHCMFMNEFGKCLVKRFLESQL